MTARLAALVMIFLTIPVFAAEPQLPPQGSWSRYYVQAINYGGVESNYEIVLKSLGPTTVDDVKCRWIEIYYPEDKKVPVPWTGATKLAIPEKLILSGARLISDKTQGLHYYQQEGSDPDIGTIAGKRKAGTVFLHEMLFGTYLKFLPGPRKSAKVTESRQEVLYQTGRLISTEALSGKSDGDFINSNDIRTHWDATYRIQTGDEIPFGFASAEFEWETSFPDHANTGLTVSSSWIKKEIWTLQEFGQGATSSIPEQK